ncbi:MAG: cadmium-translocating P-type ATPase [Lachnospiraceae bacterium]|nr:cadmium-translocating P-type ATPase [Lachnospiraceae bacterium]
MSEKYNVTGMSCAACQMHVEKAVSKVAGVENVTVSLLTNSMTVEGAAGEAEIIKAVEDAGYGASKAYGRSSADGSAAGEIKTSADDYARLKAEEEALIDKETPKMVRRLCTSIIFLLALMYFSMGHTMWGFPVPEILDNYASLGLLEMLLALIVMYINRKFFISGFTALRHGGANMDTLVAMGSGAAFLYSLAALFLVMDAMGKGDGGRAMYLAMNHMYFESAAMILTLITIGKMLEAYSKGRTTDALKALMRLTPQTANVERGGEVMEIGIAEVQVGDIFVVKPGESIPVDGIITDGVTAVNEAALTGESIPVDKSAGDMISAATINTSGYIKGRATRVGADTTLSQIIKMVSDAAATKAPLARIADKVSGIFCPAVMIVALLTLIGWLIAGAEFGKAFARAISVLVISCPCALGLATPVAIMVGNGMGARNGILYKTATSLEGAGRTEIIALDKTGTITNGTPVVTDIIPAEGVTKEDLFGTAAAVEAKSEHPLSKAVISFADAENVSISEVTEFEAIPGKGLKAMLDGESIYGGNAGFISEIVEINADIKAKAETLSKQGKTPLYFANKDRLLGIIAVADTIKEEAPEAIRQLKNMGIKVVMLTGDNERTAEAIGAEAGVDDVVADVKPDGKESIIRQLRQSGKVAMVGDGINDAPALTRADTGIAIGAGTDVAIDAADIVLVKSRLTDVPAAIRMSRATIRNIHENLFWAFFYNIICIPLAIGLYQALFHWSFEMKPMVGALAMSFSSVTVCVNALRLNLFKLYDASHDRKISTVNKTVDENRITVDNSIKEASQKEETKTMTKTMNINGMMCEHCEMTVKKALESLDGVASAEVSHTAGTAVVELTGDVADDTLKSAVEAKDYEVTAIA